MFKDNFVLIGFDMMTKEQLESVLAIENQRLLSVTKPADINHTNHIRGDITYVINLSKISSYASDIFARIAEFYNTDGVYFVVIANKKSPKLLRKLKFKTLELRCG